MISIFRRIVLLRLRRLWSMTQFRSPALSMYAENSMLGEVRRGVMWMAALSVLLHLAAVLLYMKLGHGKLYLYTYGLMVILALHVLFAAPTARTLGELHTLGITLLVVTSAALVLLAHRQGTVDGPLLTSVVLLFMLIPFVPWGLGQCMSALALVYGVFTASTYGVAERFPPEQLWTLQFLMLAAAITAIALVARNVSIRRDDIKFRYRLERAHRKMQLLSQQDSLTGAWNRRFLDAHFYHIVEGFRPRNKDINFAMLDVDNFKGTNDRYGHHHGDAVLRQFARIFRERLGDDGFLIRLGGDEFALLYCGDDIDELLFGAFAALRAERVASLENADPITASAGVVRFGVGDATSLDVLYRRADEALYAEKQRRGRRAPTVDFGHTTTILGEPA